MEFMKLMSEHWDGPLSMAIYVPFPKDHPKGIDCRRRIMAFVKGMTTGRPAGFTLSLMYAHMEAIGNHCNFEEQSQEVLQKYFNVPLWQQRYNESTYIDIWDGLYPVNAMRNLAKRQVQKDTLMLTIDSDLIPSRDAYEILKHGASKQLLIDVRANWEAKQLRTVVVVPTFERLKPGDRRLKKEVSRTDDVCPDGDQECWMYKSFDMPASKKRLIQRVDEGAMQPFYAVRFPRGHGCYDPMGWLNATQPYTFDYDIACEPYTFALKSAMPDFDERFRGRLFDKISHLQHMALFDANFVVDPNNFLVHIPHENVQNIDDYITWFPARQDKYCVPHTLLYLFREEVELKRIRSARQERADKLQRTQL